MRISKLNRWLMLGVVALAAFWVAVVERPDNAAKGQVAEPVERPAAIVPVKDVSVDEEDVAEIDLKSLKRLRSTKEARDLFTPQSWVAPPPLIKLAPPPPPPRPQAPALPFKYFGKLKDGEVTKILLLTTDAHYSVTVGDTLEGKYSVDNISDSAIAFTYIPLKQKQYLPIEGTH